MINLDTKELIRTFKNKGYKVTTQRLAIFKIILSRTDHPTTETIYQELKKEYPTISLGTIYKTLHLLKDIGLIQELGFNEGSIRYDRDLEPHINIVCSNCGKIYDHKTKTLKNLWRSIVSETGVKPNGQRIDLYYVCDDCKKVI